MKKRFTHYRLLTVVAFAAAFAGALAACGGNSASNIALTGTITGLTADGLTLSLNGTSNTVQAANAAVVALPRVAPGSSYSVTVAAQPPGLTCRVSNGSGVAGNEDIGNVNVACVPNYSLGGSISGLTVSGLVLANGSDTVSPPANSTSFVFPTKVGDGFSYGVTILSQPAGQNCTIQNGTGFIGSTDATSVVVTCA